MRQPGRGALRPAGRPARRMPRRRGFQSARGSAPSRAAACSASHRPMAGALVRPGLSMPAASKKPGASAGSPSTKSSPVSWARSPLKEVMTARSGSPSTPSAALRCKKSSSAAVVAVFSLVGGVGGGGAQQQIAVHGRGDQHPLAGLARQLEDRALHMAAGAFVQQAVIPLARGDGQPPRADLVGAVRRHRPRLRSQRRGRSAGRGKSQAGSLRPCGLRLSRRSKSESPPRCRRRFRPAQWSARTGRQCRRSARTAPQRTAR